MANEKVNAERREIGEVGNYYGGLSTKQDDGNFYWSIENYDGENWREITKELFNELNDHQDSIELNNL